MKFKACGKILMVLTLAFGLLISGLVFAAPQKTRLTYMMAGDVNMLALGQHVLAPKFEQKYPNITLSTIHTGPGNAGSRRIFEKVLADKKAGREVWDKEEENILRGKILQASYLGNVNDYRIKVGDWVIRTSVVTESVFKIGKEVYVIFSPENIAIMPEKRGS